MDPNAQDQSQQTGQTSTTPSTLPQPPTPPETSVPPAPQAVQPAYAPTPVPQQTKSKKGLIIALAVGIPLLFIIGGAILFAVFMYPSLQSKAFAMAFMSSMTSGNVDAAVKATGDDSSRSFLSTAATAIKGSAYAPKSSDYHGSGESYYLYTLSGGDYTSARVILTNKDGKRTVSSFVYGKQQLSLKPSATTSDSSASSGTDSSSTPQPTTASTGCLKQDDYKWFFYDKQPSSETYDSVYDPANYSFNVTSKMFFMPDTINEESLLSVYDDWADFASHNTSKQWKFRLEGSTYGADSGTDGAKNLANARSERVKSQLVSRGVSADRIIIDAPHDYSSEGQDFSNHDIFRSVSITIDPTCN